MLNCYITRGRAAGGRPAAPAAGLRDRGGGLDAVPGYSILDYTIVYYTMI